MKTYFIRTLLLSLFFLLFAVATIVVIDPNFHYHKPVKGVAYILDNERYQNYGISKNFDYDGLIIGTSMTQNFKTSEMDRLFECTAIKTPFSGASFYEINNALNYAIDNNNKLTVVVRCIDSRYIISEKDALWYDDLPKYLYDDKIINDGEYILNKGALYAAIRDIYLTLCGGGYNLIR